jgi:predicted site-specific integrase-resolvase
MGQQTKTVILARVSSKSQEDEGYSLDSQLKLLHGYCLSKGLSVEDSRDCLKRAGP